VDPVVRLLPDIERALTEGRPVVALESSVLAQGLPIPSNAEAARRMTQAVERSGAVAGIAAVVRGIPTIGLTTPELDRFLARNGVRKVSARDIPAAMAANADGATTVAATLVLAKLAGIDVFATGGIGGVHRAAPGSPPTYDESADLPELAAAPIIVVCAGAKSILDLHATWERLETLGIPVVGYRTEKLPGFFTADTGISLTDCATSAAEIAERFAAHRALGRRQAMLVVQPPPARYALDASRVEHAVETALRSAQDDGVRGAAMTPYLLERVTRLTEGRSLEANLALLEQNAALAGEVAAALRGTQVWVRNVADA
jgi:pseudouridylate synthase